VVDKPEFAVEDAIDDDEERTAVVWSLLSLDGCCFPAGGVEELSLDASNAEETVSETDVEDESSEGSGEDELLWMAGTMHTTVLGAKRQHRALCMAPSPHATVIAPKLLACVTVHCAFVASTDVATSFAWKVSVAARMLHPNPQQETHGVEWIANLCICFKLWAVTINTLLRSAGTTTWKHFVVESVIVESRPAMFDKLPPNQRMYFVSFAIALLRCCVVRGCRVMHG